MKKNQTVNEYSVFSSIQEPVEVNELLAKEHFTKEHLTKEYEKTIKVMLRCVPVNIGKKDAISIAKLKSERQKARH